MEWKAELQRMVEDSHSPASRLRFGEPLSKHTYFGIGGPATVYYEVGSIEDLIRFTAFKSQQFLPIALLGRGSNFLVSDNGFEGMVIRLVGDFDQIRYEGDSVCAGGGVSQPKLAKSVAGQGLSGLEFALGIPGSVGGAMIMNAGAWGNDFGERVEQVRVMTDQGEILKLCHDQAGFAYRRSKLDKYFCVLDASLRLVQGNPKEVTQLMRKYYQRKITTQPFVEGSAGCMFRNPPNHSAGKLIEECRLKGTRIGDAEVSTTHGNFIINHGKAKAKDVLELIDLIQNRVKAEKEIDLQMEVKLLGF